MKRRKSPACMEVVYVGLFLYRKFRVFYKGNVLDECIFS